MRIGSPFVEKGKLGDLSKGPLLKGWGITQLGQKPAKNIEGALRGHKDIYLNWSGYRVPGVRDATRHLQRPHMLL
jgi:hypothetical protein